MQFFRLISGGPCLYGGGPAVAQQSKLLTLTQRLAPFHGAAELNKGVQRGTAAVPGALWFQRSASSWRAGLTFGPVLFVPNRLKIVRDVERVQARTPPENL